MECPALSPPSLQDVESKAKLIRAGENSSSGTESQRAETPLQSSWIQRLKPRDGVRQDISLECFDSVSLQNKDCKSVNENILNASGLVKGSVDLEKGRENAERKAKYDTGVRGGAHGSLSKYESSTNAGSETVEASTVVQSTSGFGPWLNIPSCRKPFNKYQSEFDGIYSSSKTGDSAIMQTKQIQEKSMSRGSQAFSTLLGKPPLPPLKPKPQTFVTSKTDGVLGPGIVMAISQAKLDTHEIRQDSERVSCYSEHTIDREVSQVISAAHEEHASQNGSTSSSTMLEATETLMRSSGCSQVPLLGAAPVRTKCITENPKDTANILGCVGWPSVPISDVSWTTSELVQKFPQPSSMDGSQVTARSAGGGAISSTSQGLGVDPFLPLLPKEHEQFLEVYNQARGELKNQRNSHILSRTHSGQTFSASGNTIGKLSQTSKQQEQLEDQLLHGKPKHLNTVLKHRTESSNRHGKGDVDEDSHNSVSSFRGKSNSIHSESQSGKYMQMWMPENRTSCKGASVGLLKDSDNESNIRSTALDQHHNENMLWEAPNNGRHQSEKNPLQALFRDNQGRSSLLGKRQYESSENNKGSKSVPNGGDISQSKYNFWIQRWYTNAKPNTEGLPKHSLHFSDAMNHGMKKFKSNAAIEGTNPLHENKSLVYQNTQMQSGKTLPSAAAMAIVGTAARQFCTTQPQRKRSFGFWAGFDTFISQKLEPELMKGKAKLFSKDNS